MAGMDYRPVSNFDVRIAPDLASRSVSNWFLSFWQIPIIFLSTSLLAGPTCARHLQVPDLALESAPLPGTCHWYLETQTGVLIATRGSLPQVLAADGAVNSVSVREREIVGLS